MKYKFGFGRVFSWCSICTPTIRVKMPSNADVSDPRRA